MNDEYLNFAKEMAYKAGEIMLKYFETDNGVIKKLGEISMEL